MNLDIKSNKYVKIFFVGKSTYKIKLNKVPHRYCASFEIDKRNYKKYCLNYF